VNYIINYYIIFIIFLNNSNGYVLHCSESRIEVSMRRRDELIQDILPVSAPFTTTIDIQISYVSGVRLIKSSFLPFSNHIHPV